MLDYDENTPHIGGEGDYDLEVVGVSFHQTTLKEISSPPDTYSKLHYCTAYLESEPNNEYDQDAVAVYIDNKRVGYLRKGLASVFTSKYGYISFTMDAVIICGWSDERGSGSYGVRLDL